MLVGLVPGAATAAAHVGGGGVGGGGCAIAVLVVVLVMVVLVVVLVLLMVVVVVVVVVGAIFASMAMELRGRPFTSCMFAKIVAESPAPNLSCSALRTWASELGPQELTPS